MQKMAISLIMILVFAMGALFVRVATVGHEPSEWHVDPFSIERPVSPNTYYLAVPSMVSARVDREAPIYTVPTAIMAKAFNDYVLTQSNVILLAGSVEEGWLTYVQRTPTLRIPDYITVKFVDFEDGSGSTLAIYSRSRYGYGDMGYNKARVENWLQSLSSFEE